MKKYKNEFVLGLIALVLIGVFIFFIFRARNSIEQYTTSKDENIYFYVDDVLMEYSGKLTLDINKNITDLYNSEINLDSVSEPIYFKDEDKVLFPKLMSVIRPTIGLKQNKIPEFTTISKTDTYSKLSGINIDMNLSDAIIYDGVNTYFFVDDVTIEIGENKIDLPAFSYIKCGFKDIAYVYNYESKEMKFYDNIKDVIYASNSKYRINLSTDSIFVDDKSVILMKNIKGLSIIK